jgi:hypothetical protein
VNSAGVGTASPLLQSDADKMEEMIRRYQYRGLGRVRDSAAKALAEFVASVFSRAPAGAGKHPTAHAVPRREFRKTRSMKDAKSLPPRQ